MTDGNSGPNDPTRSPGTEIAALVAALGLGDSDTVATLYTHGVRAETVPLLEWLPAADICWVDGADVAERHALRVQFVADDRSTPDGLALLDSWLTEPPAPPLLDAASRALAARLRLLDEDQREATLARIVARCEAAGRAAGADFGVGPLSAPERERIHELRRALLR